MHIKLKNKNLHFHNYKVKCAIGKRGISNKKREGDNCTPKGTFKFIEVFYRKDRNKKIKTLLKKTSITKNMGWCDDSRSKKYNKLVRLPFAYKSEKLYKKNNLYDVLIVINYNFKPTVRNKGSAIFLHIANKSYKSTRGCIAVSKKDMKILLKYITKKTKLFIY